MLPLPQGEDKGEGMTVKRARYFRKSATKAEKRLWSHLRNRQVASMKFRRQHPIGHRIVDFFCAEAKLAIELDGSGHHRHFGETHDLDQAIDLYEKGIRLLRFSNHDVFDNLDGVLNAIIYAIDPERSLWPTSRESRTRHMIGPSPLSSPWGRGFKRRA